MPVNTHELINVLAELCESKNLVVTISSSLKGGVATGIAATIGGILMGPIGLAIGGALGGIVSAKCQNNFKSVSVVLREMTPQQKAGLINKVKLAFQNVGVSDIAALATLILNSSSLQELAIREISNFLSNEMRLRVC